MFRNTTRISSLRRKAINLGNNTGAFGSLPVPAKKEPKGPIVLYVLHIGGTWDEGYYDSVHTEYDAFRYSRTDEDTVDQLTVPKEVASRLLSDYDGFADGYDRYRFLRKYITRKGN